MHPLLPAPDKSLAPIDARRIRYYGCVECQRLGVRPPYHAEGTKLFREHLYWQSKHGVQEMGREAYFALVCQQN